MAKFVHARNNFTYGETSPEFHGRNDIEQYKNMCEKIKNFIVLPQGGVKKRPGTRFHAYDTDIAESTAGKIIPFYREEGAISHYAIVVTYDGSLNIVFAYTGVNKIGQSVGIAPASSLTSLTQRGDITIDDLWGGFTQDDFDKLSWDQSGNILVITHPTCLPVVVFWDGSALCYHNWGLIFDLRVSALFPQATQYHRTIPFRIENSTATTITASATTGTAVTLTSSSNINWTVGSWFRMRTGSTVGVAYLTAVGTSGTTATAMVKRTLPGTTANANWSESYWGDAFGFPSAVGFHENRLYFAGTDEIGDHVFGSQDGDIYEFSKEDPSGTYTVADSFDVVPLSRKNSRATWLRSNKNLILGTGESFGVAAPLDRDVAIGRGNIKFEFYGYPTQGSVPISIENSIMYLQRGGLKLREATYDYRVDGYVSSDLSYFSSNISVDRSNDNPAADPYCGKIREIAWQVEKNSVVWAVTKSGLLLGCTRYKEYDTLAWHHHVLGGEYFDGASTGNVRVISIGSFPADFGDVLVLLTLRTIAGVSQMVVESMVSEPRLESMYDPDVTYSGLGLMEQPIFLDCFVSAASPPVGMVYSGFDVFAEETIYIWADGFFLGVYEVNVDGEVTLDSADYDVVIGGYSYDSELIPLALESNSLFGNGLGQIKRVDEVTFIFSKTVGTQFGLSEAEPNDLEDINFRPSATPSGTPTPLFTGEKTLKLKASPERKQQVKILHAYPYPCTVLSIIHKGVLYD